MATAMTVTKARPAQDDTISFPVLTYTDAEPRHDLQGIHSGSQHHQSNQTVGQWDFPRPRPADGRSSKKPPPPGISATFDFQLTAPPDEVIPSSARSARSPIGMHTIGVALGSPGMLGPQELPPPRFNAALNGSQQSPQLGKSSKWKKIGGIFKAKNALSLPTTNEDGTTTESDLASKDKSNPKTSKKHRDESTEEWPKIEVESKPSGEKNPSTKRGRKFSFSNRKNSKEKNEPGPMLEVNIPDVQMERYSVMFSNVMTKNQRPSLLARRSKTLDHLRVPSSQDFISSKSSKVPPVPQRRATSPARSSFTLFPTSQPSKAAQVLGTQNFSRGPSPLMRSNTLPVESPSKAASFDQPRPFTNNNTLSSFESPVIANLFSERCNTPQSSTGSTRKEDKPLPAIKPEPPVAQPRSQLSSPQVPPKPNKAPVHTNNTNVNMRPTEQRRHHSQNQNHTPRHQNEKINKSRPTLNVKTDLKAPPRPPAKDRLTPKPTVTAIPIKSKSMDDVSHISSPAKVASPLAVRNSSKTASVPVITEREIRSPEVRMNKKLPKIEVSTARSISVSKGRKQMLVPITSRVDQLHPNERLVERRAMTPTIMDAQGHRHAASQELQIESM